MEAMPSRAVCLRALRPNAPGEVTWTRSGVKASIAPRTWGPVASNGRIRTTSEVRYVVNPGPGVMILMVWPRSTSRSATAFRVVVVPSTAG